MTRTASISTTLPDAGKPTGRCEECGPHGNGGRVELLYSVVDCLTCAWRADLDALHKVDDFDLELRAQAQPGEKVAVTQEISPIDPARVWGRRVKVTCTYSATPTGAPSPVTVSVATVVEPCAVCRKSTVGDLMRLGSQDVDPKSPPAFVCAHCRTSPTVPSCPMPREDDPCAVCHQEIGHRPRILFDPKNSPQWVHFDPADCGASGVVGPSFAVKVLVP